MARPSLLILLVAVGCSSADPTDPLVCAGKCDDPADDGRECSALPEEDCLVRFDCVARRFEGGGFGGCTSIDPPECTAGSEPADIEPCPGAVYEDRATTRYVLPYEIGTTHNVRQGNCNLADTHNGGESFAYDFEMPIGTPLVAARGGVVFAVVDNFTDDQHGLDQGNVVAIDHGDQTYAKYGHITQGGALVAVGDVVAQGDIIALSGNSGASRGPHCHFAVKACPPGVPVGTSRCTSIPVSFANTIGHPHGLLGSPTAALGGGHWYAACAAAP